MRKRKEKLTGLYMILMMSEQLGHVAISSPFFKSANVT